MSYLSKEQQVRSKRPMKKKTRKKKPNNQGKTPLPSGDKICVGCGRSHGLSIHHVFNSSSRRFSNQYNCVEWLCWHCHQGPKGIHGGKTPNIYLDYNLRIKHQKRLIEEGMSIVDFVFYFKMDYISVGYEGYKSYRLKGLNVV